MFYKILSCLALLFFTSNLFAQDVFPDETQDQKWEYVTWYFWGGHCERRVIKTGDRVAVCDQEYIEVYDCNEWEQQCYLVGYYRVEDERVIIRRRNYINEPDSVYCAVPEGLMYDFGVAYGDTLSCRLETLSYPNFWKVDEQMVEYEGVERNTLTMDFQPHLNAPNFIRQMKWVEGIGSNIHPFYSLSCIGDHCELEQQLTKVTRGGELIYQDTILSFGFPCTSWVTVSPVEEEIKIQQFDVYPNPTNSYFSIQTKGNNISHLDVKVYNSLGQLMISKKRHFVSEKIEVDALEKGIYFIQLSSKEKSEVVKVLVE